MYNLLNGTEHCMYSNCQSYIHVLKFSLTGQSHSKNGAKYCPAGRKERYRQRKVPLCSFYINAHNRGQLGSLMGGADGGGGGGGS